MCVQSGFSFIGETHFFCFNVRSRIVLTGIMYLYFAVFVLLVPLVRSADCGGNLNANPSVSYLQYPDFPLLYDNDLDCTWIISGVASKCVCIEFDFFSVEENDNCTEFDWVTVDTGSEVGDGDIGRFCGGPACFQSGHNPLSLGNICTNSSTITVQLHTDDIVKAYGFRLKYYAVPATAVKSLPVLRLSVIICFSTLGS